MGWCLAWVFLAMVNKTPSNFLPGEDAGSDALLSPNPLRRQQAQVEFLLKVAVAAGLCSHREAERLNEDCRAENTREDSSVAGCRSLEVMHDFEV